jgi:hypothetical protein
MGSQYEIHGVLTKGTNGPTQGHHLWQHGYGLLPLLVLTSEMHSSLSQKEDLKEKNCYHVQAHLEA